MACESSRWGWLLAGLSHSLLAVITAVAFGLAFIHITGFPFSAVLESKEELGGYAEVMRFLSPFSTAEFYLSDFPFSERGAQHFAECKVLFRNIYIIGLLAGLPIYLFLQFYRKCLPRRFWFTSGISLLVLITIVGISILLRFDSTFVIMHKVLFNNDLWLFNMFTDPIIRVFKTELFAVCGVVFLFFILAATVLSFINGLSVEKSPEKSCLI